MTHVDSASCLKCSTLHWEKVRCVTTKWKKRHMSWNSIAHDLNLIYRSDASYIFLPPIQPQAVNHSGARKVDCQDAAAWGSPQKAQYLTTTHGHTLPTPSLLRAPLVEHTALAYQCLTLGLDTNLTCVAKPSRCGGFVVQIVAYIPKTPEHASITHNNPNQPQPIAWDSALPVPKELTLHGTTWY